MIDVNLEELEDPYSIYDWTDFETAQEFLRLIKLGLWAENFAQPALEVTNTPTAKAALEELSRHSK